jgi:hypothetical protein
MPVLYNPDLMVLQIRIFLVTAKCCTYAVWQDDRKRLIDKLRVEGLLSLGVLAEYFTCYWYVPSVPKLAHFSKLSLGDSKRSS